MSKPLPYILGTIALIFIAIGFSKASAFDIVSSPTWDQNDVFTSSALNSAIDALGRHSCGGTYNGDGTMATFLWISTSGANGTLSPCSCGQSGYGVGTRGTYKILKNIDSDNYFVNIQLFDEYTCTMAPFYFTFLWQVSTSKLTAFPGGVAPFVFWDTGNSRTISYVDLSNTLTFKTWNFSSFTGTTIQTIAKPSSPFAVMPTTYPVYLDGLTGTKFFAYQGTDGKSYRVIDSFASGQDLPVTIAGTGSVVPMGKFYTNDVLFARQTAGSGSVYVEDWATATPFWETSTGYVLTKLNTFQNPIAYFNTSVGTIVKWDLNCKTAGYDSCVLNGGIFKCANSAGTLSPGGELCGGTVSPPSTGGGGSLGSPGTTFSNNGLVCTTISYPSFTSTPYSIGNATFSDNSSGATLPDRYSFQWLSTDGSYRDQFAVYPSTGLYLDTDTFTGGLSAGKTTTIYSDLDAISAGNATSLAVSLTRSGRTSVVNYVKIKTQNQGFSPLNSNQKNIVAEVRFNGLDGQVHTYPLVYSGGYATALSRFPSNHVNIRFTTGTVTFDGFEIGYSNSGTTSKTSCRNSGFSCQYTQQSPGVFSCDSALNVSGIPQWECEIVSNICQPKANIVPYYDGAVVPGGAVEQAINSSGAVVGLDYQGEDIFSCSETGLSVLICPFTVLGKVWGKFTFVIKKLVNLIYGISSLGSPSWQGNIFSFLIPSAYASAPQLATPFDISGSGTSSTSYTGSDMMNLNKTILRASDNVFNMDSGGIKGIYALSMWFLILVGVVFVIVIFLIAFI